MRRMWSDLLSWIVGGLMSSSTHAASFCLPICAASLRFQHTYMCFNSLCLLFDLPHLLLGHLQNIFKAPCLLHASGLWKKGKENSCTNNRCVLWSQAATSIFERMVCSQPLTQVNKVCWEKGGENGFCVQTVTHQPTFVCWWADGSWDLEWLLQFFFIFFLVLWQWYSHARALPFPPRQCDSWACMLMCACLYTLAASVPYRFNQTRLAEETEKCPISSWIPTLHITICTGQVEVKVRSGLWLFFSPPPREKPHKLFSSY